MKNLTDEQIKKELASLKGWSFNENQISKRFEFQDFKEALSFIVRVGFEAESLTHHPSLHNVYNTVTISLQTHDAGNKVTSNDIDLARVIELIL